MLSTIEVPHPSQVQLRVEGFLNGDEPKEVTPRHHEWTGCKTRVTAVVDDFHYLRKCIGLVGFCGVVQ